MHAKTDSDVTSLPGSSPTRSPPRRAGPVYYVQSPSRDSSSHDGEKATTNSFHSTPVISPMGSPPHSHSNSSLGPHSRESSSTRYSGSGKPGSKGDGRKVKPGGGNGQRWKDHHHRHHHPFDAIEEESLLGGEDEEKGGIPRRCCYFIWFVVAFFALFSFFSLVLWGASRNQKPLLTMKNIRYSEFDVQAGLDSYGVPTAMATMNVTVKLIYRNRGTFFGVHVTSTPLQLSFEDLILASGMMKYFYEGRKSQRQVTVQLKGQRVPLYGGGYTLSSNHSAPLTPVPLTLNFRVRSRAYVLGRLVKPKFYKAINCALVMDPKKMNMALPLKHNCTYT